MFGIFISRPGCTVFHPNTQEELQTGWWARCCQASPSGWFTCYKNPPGHAVQEQVAPQPSLIQFESSVSKDEDQEHYLVKTVSPLHTILQVANLQRYERACGSIKEPEPVPSMTGVSEIAACPPSPIANDPSAPPSPTSSLSSSKQLCLPAHLMPAPVCQLLYSTTILFKVLYCKIKSLFFILCICLCIICVKSIRSLLRYSTI